jgi:hypothetical protein
LSSISRNPNPGILVCTDVVSRGLDLPSIDDVEGEKYDRTHVEVNKGEAASRMRKTVESAYGRCEQTQHWIGYIEIYRTLLARMNWGRGLVTELMSTP